MSKDGTTPKQRRSLSAVSAVLRRAVAVGAVLMMCAVRSGVAADPASPFGFWLTADDRAAVELFVCGTNLCGRLAWIDETRPPPGATGPSRDINNPEPALRSRLLCGLTIMTGFEATQDPAHWTGGEIYDPDSGNTYRGQLTVEPGDRLRLRGYILLTLFGRTEVWRRAPPTFDRRCTML